MPLFCLLGVMISFLSCAATPTVRDGSWATAPDCELMVRIVPMAEIKNKFGYDAESNPFIAPSRLVFEDKYFTVIELWNAGSSAIFIGDAFFRLSSGKQSIEVLDADAMKNYWSVQKLYADSRDDKREIIDAKCLVWKYAIKPTAKKYLVIATKEIVSENIEATFQVRADVSGDMVFTLRNITEGP